MAAVPPRALPFSRVAASHESRIEWHAAPPRALHGSSLLSGRYTHNHGAVNNSLAGGCASKSWIHGVESDALAVHMAAANYSSLYAGKYLK